MSQTQTPATIHRPPRIPAHARVVRLNARTHPPGAHEMGLYARCGLTPEVVEATTPEDLHESLRTCDAVCVVSSSLDAATIRAMSRCRIIARFGIGTDRIDVGCATQAGIVVANVPGFCSDEMADHAMALLLSLARQLPRMTRSFAAGTLHQAHVDSERNRRLAGRVLGLVGFGDSAKRLARRAQAFGMRIIATRRSRSTVDPDARDLGVTMTDLETVLTTSDYLSLHLPLSPETRHLIDARAIARMKPGACVINTARGGLIDETALVAALRRGSLGGAGLDTFETIDPFTLDDRPVVHPLCDLDTVVMTPHVAADSVEAARTVLAGGIENLVCVLAGRWPRPERIVNPTVQPRQPLAAYDPSWAMDPDLEGIA